MANEHDPHASHDSHASKAHGVTRRGFLTGAGAGAAGAMVLPAEVIGQQSQNFGGFPKTRSDRFSRLFATLPPFAEPTPDVLKALEDLGAPNGLMDAADPLHLGPKTLITNPELSPNNSDNAAHTAGVTFLGQFLDHDMTFDTASPLGVPTTPEKSPNTRTPKFDLDSVYGGGPFVTPQLYDPSDKAKFKVESSGVFEDLPRSADGTAIIADPRNDENLMIAGLQSAFLLFHNRVVDKLRGDDDDGKSSSFDEEGFDAAGGGGFGGGGSSSLFKKARDLVTWHYQWIIVHEFLPAIVGAPLVNQILSKGPGFYKSRLGDEESIPVEFQIAYRFGHSLIRPSYRANLAGDVGGQPFFGFIFDPAGEGQADPVDLRGGSRAARRFIGWQTFFKFEGTQAAEVRPNKVIDTRISTPLFHLPLGAIASGAPPISLPQRNLLRHLTWSLPSGQAIANELKIPALSPTQLAELAQFGVGFEESTPLWYYILKEAELAGGARLTGVGARIVAEVFLALLMLDEGSFLYKKFWKPSLPSKVPKTFTMVDLLTYARVDPASRGQ
jgi:hypothetical protein